MGHHVKFVRALGLLALAVVLTHGVASRDADSAAGPHPFYDDAGTLTWYTSLSEARVAAARAGKLIFVDYSQPDCEICEQMIGELLPSRDLGPRIARIAVGLHIDAAVGNRQLYDMFKSRLRNAKYLPWIAFVTPGQNWVSGMAPSRLTTDAELRRRLVRTLVAAEARQGTLVSVRGDVPVKGDPGDPDGSAVVDLSPPRPSPTETNARRGANTARASEKLRWFTTLSEAQAAARASGKMIFIISTKPRCGLCKKLKDEIAPRIATELAEGAVVYVYDITRPESVELDGVVRANLPGAYLMPLSGFITPDMRWLHGFFGKTDVQTLRADYRTALGNMR